MYAPHTVTLYNVSEDAETLQTIRSITVLKGVFLDISKASNVQKSGMENADAATLYIPFSVFAYDPLTGNKKMFVTPRSYMALEDKTDFWTLMTSGDTSANPTFFVKGIISDDESYGYIRNKYDFVYDVTSVDTKDFGSPNMQHWQVGGR